MPITATHHALIVYTMQAHPHMKQHPRQQNPRQQQQKVSHQPTNNNRQKTLMLSANSHMLYVNVSCMMIQEERHVLVPADMMDGNCGLKSKWSRLIFTNT